MRNRCEQSLIARRPRDRVTVAPDVVALGAEQIWEQLGYTGMGVVVSVIDTGRD